jgi:dodecin
VPIAYASAPVASATTSSPINARFVLRPAISAVPFDRGELHHEVDGAFRVYQIRVNASEGETMTESIYRVTEVIGTSTTSWEEAAKNAVETAAQSLRDLRVGEIVKLDLAIEDGKVAHYRARVNISFKYEHE